MKIITIAGGLTRDAVLRRTQGGDPILGFSVGVSEGRDKPSTYFDCSLFGRRAEALEQYLRKGSKVTVCGDLSTRDHEGKTYLQVRVNEVTMQGGGQRNDGNGDAGGYQSGPQGGGYGGGQSGGANDLDEDLPF